MGKRDHISAVTNTDIPGLMAEKVLGVTLAAARGTIAVTSPSVPLEANRAFQHTYNRRWLP